MDFTDLYTSLAEADIDRFISSQQEENLVLDFKLVTRADLSHADDKRNLARALSGFANSSGGLIVWGVDARKNAENVDCACGKRPIQNVGQFLARLNELTGSFVSPLVDGVFHRTIADRSGAGYAVTLVPPSDSGPHMAKGGEDRYFKRSGDSFYRMEHFDLEDMFGRRKRPKLSLHTSIVEAGSVGGGGQTEYRGKLVIAIENTGRGIARSPYLELQMSERYGIDRNGLMGNGHEGLDRLAHAGPPTVARYGAGSDRVIHPGVLLEVAAVRVSAVARSDNQLVIPQPLRIAYTIAAEGVAAVSGTVDVSPDDIASVVFPASIYVGKDERARIASQSA